MKSARMIEQLNAMLEETQSAPEFRKLLAELEAPRRLSVNDLERSMIQRSEHSTAAFDKAVLWRWLLVAGEVVIMVGLLYHLYTYADTPLAALTVGAVADIAVSGVVFCLLGLALYRSASAKR